MKFKKIIISCIAIFILISLALSVSAYTGNGTTIVYITETGGRYHTGGCGSLYRSKISIKLEDAIIEGYTRCERCSPPRYTGTAKPGDPKPVSDSSGSSGSTNKGTSDFSWLEDREPPAFATLTTTTEEANVPSSSAKTAHSKEDGKDRSEYSLFFWIGSLLIIILSFGPASSLSERYHSDVIHPYEISCSATFISILGCFVFYWSAVVIIVVFIPSAIVIAIASKIGKQKYAREQEILRKEREKQAQLEKEKKRQEILLQMKDFYDKRCNLINKTAVMAKKISKIEPFLPIIEKEILALENKSKKIVEDNNAYISEENRLFSKDYNHLEIGVVYCFPSGNCYHLRSCRNGRGHPVSLLTSPIPYGYSMSPCRVCKPDIKFGWVLTLRGYQKDLLKLKNTKSLIMQMVSKQGNILDINKKISSLSENNLKIPTV